MKSRPKRVVLGVVNCVENRDGYLVGHNTDGAGLIAARPPRGCPSTASVVSSWVRRSRPQRDRGTGSGGIGSDGCDAGRDPGPSGGDPCGGARPRRRASGRRFCLLIVVNATSVGMGGEGLVVPADLLSPAQAVVDLVYHPVETPLLTAGPCSGSPGDRRAGRRPSGCARVQPLDPRRAADRGHEPRRRCCAGAAWKRAV